METQINIQAALEYMFQQTGTRISQRELAARMWPESSQPSRDMTMSKMANGKVKRIAVADLFAVKRITGCPWPVLLGE